ncbi:Uncharacterized protein dnl_58980 [Desulfonema limicola]|uniref:SpoVT-AbrB domain-containing protein n=1 Tax=Desulfonema limicola TaxID=45656 RepID=A0A975GK61_9BACT|nr:hypothetical protein [Desulfonema limicola]QTA83488.1 Uncharacterized protein dnl_58980 [Desulfonema limicola]
MLAKITSKNQITIPIKIMEQLQGVEYFDLDFKNGILFLKPLKEKDINLDMIRFKIKNTGLKPESEAVKSQ